MGKAAARMRRAPGAGDPGRLSPEGAGVAIGYADGLVLLTRLADAAEILVRDAGDGAVSALGWNATGSQLLFGLLRAGRPSEPPAGLLDTPAHKYQAR